MNALNQQDLFYLRKTQSLHALGRLAVSPESQIPHIVSSMTSGLSSDFSYEYKREGLIVWTDGANRWSAAPNLRVDWSRVRAHVARYATQTFVEAFRAADREWCRAVTGDQPDGVQSCDPSERRARASELEETLRGLAAPIWDPALTIDREATQLDLF